MISIITPTYNSAKTITATIQSVLTQNYKNIEYIIVDGGSVDSTMDIVKSYQPKFGGQMRYVSEPDKGIYDAMNKGVQMSKGDVIGILNSDDHFTSDDVLECVAKCIVGYDAVFADVHFERPNEPNKIVRYYSSEIFHPFLLRFGFMPAHPSFYARRGIFERAGGYSLDYKIASDFEMMIRLFYKHKIKAKYIKKDFVTMLTGGISTKNVKNRMLITKEDVRACRNNGLYSNCLMVSLKYLYKIFEFKL